jgi:hypothetical protein
MPEMGGSQGANCGLQSSEMGKRKRSGGRGCAFLITAQESQFEIGPAWAPRLDGAEVFGRMTLPAKESAWFERNAIYAAMVLNVSRVGSQRIVALITKDTARRDFRCY